MTGDVERELFAAATKTDLSSAIKHLRTWTSYIDERHRSDYADLIEAQAKLIAWFVNRCPMNQPQSEPDTRGVERELADRLANITALYGSKVMPVLTFDELETIVAALRAASETSDRQARGTGIVTCCVTGAIPGDGGACGDCDPCIFGEASVPAPVKRLIAEKNSLLNRIAELEDAASAPPVQSSLPQGERVRTETIKECARITPTKSETHHLQADGYAFGWEQAIKAYRAAIRALSPSSGTGGIGTMTSEQAEQS